MSTSPQKSTWPRLPDGFEFPRSSKQPLHEREQQRQIVRTAVDKPMSRPQLQMVLGTLLGDGHISPEGSYRVNHGLPQSEYLWTKYTVLQEYVYGTPSKSKRNKHGYESAGFWTASTPEFKSLRNLCYPEWEKVVTKEWLDRIDQVGFLETIAWWIGDDGSLIRASPERKKSNLSMMICTHGFSHSEVRLLISWLHRHGYQSNLYEVRKQKTYPTILLNTDSTIRMAQDLLDLTPPSMRYKLSLETCTVSLECMFCGKTYSRTQDRLTIKKCIRPCCLSKECLRARRRVEVEARPELELARQERYKVRRATDQEFGDQERAKQRVRTKILRDMNPDKFREYKNRWRAEKRAEADPKLVCGICGKTQPLPKRKRSNRTICWDPECFKQAHSIRVRADYFHKRAGLASADAKLKALVTSYPIILSKYVTSASTTSTTSRSKTPTP